MDYKTNIQEPLDFLQNLEKQQHNVRIQDNVRFIRLLKSGQCITQKEAAQAINLGTRQGQRIWKRYQTKGIDALIEVKPPTYFGKLSTFHMSRLRQFLLDDQAQTLEDIQAYLLGGLGVSYTIGGVFDLCKRLQIKNKTGRPVHIRQPPGAVEAYKKNLTS